jgi:hypothetical protein
MSDVALLHIVSNDVELRAPVNPGGERAAEARLYFNPWTEAQTRHTRGVLGHGLTVCPKIPSKIDRILIDIQQSFTRSSLCPDYVVMFELNVEKSNSSGPPAS